MYACSLSLRAWQDLGNAKNMSRAGCCACTTKLFELERSEHKMLPSHGRGLGREPC